MKLKEQRQRTNEERFLIQEFVTTNEYLVSYYNTASECNWQITPKSKELFEDFKDASTRAIELISEIRGKIPTK